MSNVTLKSGKYKPGQYANQTIILPVVGEIQFSNEGLISVPSDQADDLIIATQDSFGFYEVDDVIATAKKVPVSDSDSEEKKLPKKKTKEEKSEESAAMQKKNKEYEQTKAELELLSLAELAELAKDSGMDPESLVNMTNDKLKAELLKKLTSESSKKD